MSFSDSDQAGRQDLRLHALTGDQAREDSATGELVLEGRTGEAASADGTRISAGRIGDSFYIDLSLLAIINGAIADGTAPDLSAWRPENAQNSFANTKVDSIVLEISHQHLQLRPGARASIRAATKLATDAGGWRQINRAGRPMMWPIFWPNDIDFSDPANIRHPSEDFSAAGQPSDTRSRRSCRPAVPQTTRRATARPWPGGVPDVLPYEVGTPAAYGFAAFNGRTRADNAPEAMLSLVTNSPVPSGLKPVGAEHLRNSKSRTSCQGDTPSCHDEQDDVPVPALSRLLISRFRPVPHSQVQQQKWLNALIARLAGGNRSDTAARTNAIASWMRLMPASSASWVSWSAAWSLRWFSGRLRSIGWPGAGGRLR